MSTHRRDVARMIGSYSRRAWETWARARGLDPKQFPGNRLQAELEPQLLEPEAVHAALQEATKEEQIALARIKMQGGQVTGEELKAQLAVDGVSNPDQAIAGLMGRGLLFYDRSFEGYSRWDLWGHSQQKTFLPPLWLPAEIVERVTVPEDLGYLPLEAVAPPRQLREGPFASLQRDLYLLLQALRESPAKLLKSGDVSKRDWDRLRQVLPSGGAGENDPTAAARAGDDWFVFLWLIVQMADLLQEQDGRLTVSEAATRFLSTSEAEQTRTLVQAWLSLADWNEFQRVPTLETDYSGFGDIPGPRQLVMARALLLELLARQRPYPGWYSFPSLLASMKRFCVAFLIPRSHSSHYFAWGGPEKTDRRYRGIWAHGVTPRRHFDKDRDWEQVEGAFVRTLFEEPLVWLGVVRLGYADGELVSFELTERGAAALGMIQPEAVPQSSKQDAPAQRALVVQPNFEIVVYPEVAGVPLLVELDRFAERVRMDRAALYRLTRSHFYRGLQDGLTLTGILRTLQNANIDPIPQNVAYTLEEWERLYQRIHVRRSATLIEAADDTELRRLCALPELADATEVAPRILLLPPGVTLAGLRPAPEVIDYTAPITNALEFETPTRFRVLPGAMTPRLLHRLEQIADPVDEAQLATPGSTSGRKGGTRAAGRKAAAASGSPGLSSPATRLPDSRAYPSEYQLSREKVAAAGRWWRWEAMHQFLVQAGRNKPATEMEVALSGWAGALVPGTLSSLTVLAAPSAAWLERVMSVPAVKENILYRLTPTLALVLEENRERLAEALAAIGVPPNEALSVRDLLTAAAQAEAEAGDVLVVGPPKQRRALIEKAIAAGQRVVIATHPYGGRLTQTEMVPLRVEGEGNSASLVARIHGTRYDQHLPLNRIIGVRVLERKL